MSILDLLLESFDEAEHPRDFKGRFRKAGEVAQTMMESSMAWREREREGPLPADTPSREQQTKNWTSQIRGRLSTDRKAQGMIEAAVAENAANPKWQAFTANRPADHVVVSKPSKDKRYTLIDTTHAAHRVAGTTVMPEDNVKLMEGEGGRAPVHGGKPPAASSAYGLSAILRHEYGHSIDDSLPRDVRRRILDAIPNPREDLGYYSSIRDNELIPELLATITHPDYKSKDWPATVQEAEKRLRAALGVTG